MDRKVKIMDGQNYDWSIYESRTKNHKQHAKSAKKRKAQITKQIKAVEDKLANRDITPMKSNPVESKAQLS